MKILKFFGEEGGPLPDTYYLEEAIRFSKSTVPLMIMIGNLIEGHTFSDLSASVFSVSVSESFSFLDLLSTIRQLDLEESIEFLHEFYDTTFGGLIEGILLSESVVPKMIYSITLEEGLGLVDSSGNIYLVTDYMVTWRTRTKTLPYGYGAAPYGDYVSYGDGSAPDLDSFKVEVYDSSTDTLLRTETISISDTDSPDDDAEFTYTSAMNISDNGSFNPNIKFKVYQIDVNANESPASSIVVDIIGFE